MGASVDKNYRAFRGSGQGVSLGLGFFCAQVVRPIKIWARRMKPKSLRPGFWCLWLPPVGRGGVSEPSCLVASPLSFLSMYFSRSNGYGR